MTGPKKKLLATLGREVGSGPQDPTYGSERSWPMGWILAGIALVVGVVVGIAWWGTGSLPDSAEVPPSPVDRPFQVTPDLQNMSEALSRLHDIVAVFADPSTGMLILIGKGESNPPQAPLRTPM